MDSNYTAHLSSFFFNKPCKFLLFLSILILCVSSYSLDTTEKKKKRENLPHLCLFFVLQLFYSFKYTEIC